MIKICVGCGKRVEIDGKRKYSLDGKELPAPFFCEECLDLIDDFTEPEDEYKEIEGFYPNELDVGVLA